MYIQYMNMGTQTQNPLYIQYINRSIGTNIKITSLLSMNTQTKSDGWTAHRIPRPLNVKDDIVCEACLHTNTGLETLTNNRTHKTG